MIKDPIKRKESVRICTINWKAKYPDRAKESARAASKRWRQKHLEQARAAGRESERKRRARPEVKALRHRWKQNNREKCILYARRTLCKKHGITIDRYNEMLVAQNGVCAICDKPETEGSGWLAIDHDHLCCPGLHSCGKCIRGLICTKCNQGLGCFGESAEALSKAEGYIRAWVTSVPHDVRQAISDSADRLLQVMA